MRKRDAAAVVVGALGYVIYLLGRPLGVTQVFGGLIGAMVVAGLFVYLPVTVYSLGKRLVARVRAGD